MSWLKKTFASIELMYHGTSDTLAGKILSEGLVPGRAEVWDAEKTKEDVRSRASYGGIYFSNNFMTAYSAARTACEKFGGKRLIVMAYLQNRTPSMRIDEDHLPDPRQAFNAAFHVAANNWFYMQWYANNMYDIDKVVDAYLQDFGAYGEDIKLQERGSERQREAIRPYVLELIKAMGQQETAIAVKQEKSQTYSNVLYEFPQLANLDVTKAESDYRQAVNILTQKAKFLNVKDTKRYVYNIRSLEPISFSGKNKIVLVGRVHSSSPALRSGLEPMRVEGKYYETFEILYGNDSGAIAKVSQDLVERIGGSLKIYDQNGKVYYDDTSEE